MVSGHPVVERVLESRRTATVDGVTCGLTAIKILSGEAEFSNVEQASGCALEAQHNFDGTETTIKAKQRGNSTVVIWTVSWSGKGK